MRTAPTRRRAGRGFTLLDVLIVLVVLAFGMLALARTIGRASQEEMEAYQRTQAMTVASELVDRIDALYRIHYLQWTGYKLVDRLVGLVGLLLLVTLAVLGVRLAFGRQPRPVAPHDQDALPGADS